MEEFIVYVPALIAVTAIIVLLLNMMEVTPEQIQACVDATEWTRDRCEWELSR